MLPSPIHSPCVLFLCIVFLLLLFLVLSNGSIARYRENGHFGYSMSDLGAGNLPHESKLILRETQQLTVRREMIVYQGRKREANS